MLSFIWYLSFLPEMRALSVKRWNILGVRKRIIIIIIIIRIIIRIKKRQSKNNKDSDGIVGIIIIRIIIRIKRKPKQKQ